MGVNTVRFLYFGLVQQLKSLLCFVYFQMAIQYLLWDKLKELGNVAPIQLTNLAKFLSHMFVEPQGLPLSVLKVTLNHIRVLVLTL